MDDFDCFCLWLLQCSVEQQQTAVKSFMEESPLGEFESRLRLLEAFVCQLTHMQDDSPAKGKDSQKNVYFV